jgi:hypothetical protein
MRVRWPFCKQKSEARFFMESALVGVIATQALDWLSSAIYAAEDVDTRLREDTERGHMHAYEVLVTRLAEAAGISLSQRQIERWGWRLHKLLGIAGGLSYMALRRRYPRVGAGLGLAFGAAFFLGVGELVVPLLRLAPGPRRISWKVHARGAASHVAYGVAAEATARALERWKRAN